MFLSDDVNSQNIINIITILYRFKIKNLIVFNLSIFSISSLVVDSSRRLYLDIKDLSPDDGQIAGTRMNRDNIYLFIYLRP